MTQQEGHLTAMTQREGLQTIETQPEGHLSDMTQGGHRNAMTHQEDLPKDMNHQGNYSINIQAIFVYKSGNLTTKTYICISKGVIWNKGHDSKVT